MIVEKTGRTVESVVGVWRQLDRTTDAAAIKEEVTRRYAVSRAVCDTEVDTFLSELEQVGFVVRRPA